MPVPISTPWPCAVYTKKRHFEPYVFSHMCARSVEKLVPGDLSVDSLRLFKPGEGMERAFHHDFLVLVAGDIAQGVCVENSRSSHRARFLYTGEWGCFDLFSAG